MSLFWYVMAFICSQVVICVWIYTNLNDVKADHEKLRLELIQRLFVKTSPHAQYDLKSILGELLNHLELEIEQTSGLKIIERFKKKKR